MLKLAAIGVIKVRSSQQSGREPLQPPGQRLCDEEWDTDTYSDNRESGKTITHDHGK